ncbi:5-formyltetrahydrofolate cyclo-ligase [Salegentibacter sp. F188]|uniref:5-formyltetrahydrofolate cyclo-ligase n=1 Tax=Autumnicola patrickiae TaxID=3075591 RepID=A0ABU3E1A6_9FLAO|nr:5-formyltetrahydrofolate cyclo-ligase [Salegentibacter sp. F188]MDT0689751.1 5-formyltetrahydrofolate cyclo-ligase [Salegentibacter sp. F188]
MKKKYLRAKYKKLRLNLTTETIEDLSLQIANQLLTLPIWDFSFYHLFLSIAEQKEVDTEPILHILQGKDKNVVLPKTDAPTNELINYLLTDTTVIKKNRWNIPEPQDGIIIEANKIEVVFVPLLAFDTSGHRVGYGKGFYDKFFATCQPDVLKVGLSFFEAEEKIEDTYQSDIPLDYCVTPKNSYSFRKS